jgi:hypothetical protein
MCHSGDVWRELRRTLPLISGVVPVPEVWALSEDLEEEGVEVRALETLSDGRGLVDATEQRVSRAVEADRRDAQYSGKRTQFSLNPQVVTRWTVSYSGHQSGCRGASS